MNIDIFFTATNELRVTWYRNALNLKRSQFVISAILEIPNCYID